MKNFTSYTSKFFYQDMGIPCFLGGMARGLLGRYSPIQARQKRGEALKEADVVIMAGTSKWKSMLRCITPPVNPPSDRGQVLGTQ